MIVPDKFPLELYYRAHQPDAWFEFWQDEDFDFGHPDNPDEPSEAQPEAGSEELDPLSFSWPDQDFGDEQYKIF
jgi:hypothetical protein